MILELITAIFKLILMALSTWLEQDATKKKAKQEAVDMVKEGISKRDPSLITAGFARIKNLK